VFGSPDVIVERGVSKSTAAIAKWVHALEKAVDGKTTAAEVRKAINGAKLDTAEFESVVEREVMRGVMLGALDSAWERENDEQVKLEAFSRITMVATAPSFVSRPYDAALAFFRSKSILTRAAFDRLSAAAKKRAFTVARLASKELIGTVKSELDRMLELGKGAMIPGTHQGPDLGAFKQFMRERIESAGWTPANSSHVETIYRTNVMTAYGAGRKTEMTQPAVLKARPYWQIQGVRDDRQRDAHKAAVGTVLPADDPFWNRAYPPFGFHCRCRVVSRSEAWVQRTGATIGPVPSDLPDEGWSGSGKL
jgi:SPP1 gp7 family putative phage head morphogenesis protein